METRLQLVPGAKWHDGAPVTTRDLLFNDEVFLDKSVPQAYVNQRFGTLSGMPGWQTDRGKVYITLGPPDEVRTLSVGFAVEIWRYRYVEGLGANILITFSDPSGSGEFRRVVDPGGR